MTPRKFHIVVAESSDIVRRGIRSIVEAAAMPLAVAISEAADARQLRTATAGQRPDLILMNPSLGPPVPGTRCVMLRTALVEPEKAAMFDEVISLYDTAAVIGEKIERLIDAATNTRRYEPLSKREKEVVVCLVKGMTNRQIAESLHLSPHTVSTHRRNISAKLDIRSTSGLTVYAISNKLVKLNELGPNAPL